MSLRRLTAQHFRNLSSVDIELSPQLNIIYGHNGSGKTSLLEAISTLAQGRSFRSRQFKNIIQREQQCYVLFGQAELEEGQGRVPVGIQRDRTGKTQIKLAGKQCTSAAQLSKLLPLRVLNGHSFSLLEGSPQIRRQFMDWLVFHVEHDFFRLWQSCERALKHRNLLLKHDKIDRLQLSSWDKELVAAATELDLLRAKVFKRFSEVFHQLIDQFDDLKGVSIGYQRGWDRESDYQTLLADNVERDAELKYTRSGPHRADLRIRMEKQSAAEVLSRGQQKIVVSAMLIAQGVVFKEQTGKRCTYLIDDLPAELDQRFRQLLARWLLEIDSQVFVTGVEQEALLNAWGLERPDQRENIAYQVFHVEHGTVSCQKPQEAEVHS